MCLSHQVTTTTVIVYSVREETHGRGAVVSTQHKADYLLSAAHTEQSG